MGLGDITVNSYLDQPFHAKIKLIDVGNTPLNAIRVNLASAEDFARVGLERAYALSLLTFNVERNVNGHTFVNVRSAEKISEPYMQLLVDLAWANGQVYRSYVILLDPPNYKFAVIKKQIHTIAKRQSESQPLLSQTGIVHRPILEEVDHMETPTDTDKRGVVTYGPTVANESIWQVAQRYKIKNILLQKMILAIVGANPQAFTEGNLNGLKPGSYLLIPTNSTASRVPAVLAKSEVLAHDQAWQSRQVIEHTLLPPYINSAAPSVIKETDLSILGYPLFLSIIPPIHGVSMPTSVDDTTASRILPLASSLLFLGNSHVPAENQVEQSRVAVIPKANNIAGNKNSVSSVSNEQFLLLQADNKRLQQQLAKRDKDIEKLHKQISLMAKGPGAVSTSIKSPLTVSSIWEWFIFLVVLATGGRIIYRWRKTRVQEDKPVSVNFSTSTKIAEPQPLTNIVENVINNEPVREAEATAAHPVITSPPMEATIVPPVVEQEIHQKTPVNLASTDDHFLEYEPSIQPTITATPEPKVIVPELTTQAKPSDLKDDEHIIDFMESPVTSAELSVPQPLSLSTEGDAMTDEQGASVNTEAVITSDFVLNPVEQPTSSDVVPPVKSKAALVTLLALAKTYIAMDDVETAKQSLQEVIAFGTTKQKLEATSLLDQLNKK